MRKLFKFTFLAVTLCTISSLYATVPSSSPATSQSSDMASRTLNDQTYQIGLMVEALQSALKKRDEEALQTIYRYGTDSRYYSMIRGWLFQELVNVESLLHAHKGKKSSIKFQNHSNFLKKAIRSIDLE
ncbi:hypothetical protein CW745_07435 [Psychromonas sp. psych-6C06]|uniref:hypothetical protein n=1 Tax=Psychromonas sp. psych-6C06 TaxID=2058089 RepID=UPI000C34075A|nr:hypothetical protein [Psychromonas sp. psych-6C06]PKF62208.1 hypothetical protein CW745_07435 [Psychromonas sp. psych-6C06]